MKKSFYTSLLCGVMVLGITLNANAVVPMHYPFFGWATLDLGSAAGRIVSTAIKYFLGDDTKLVADLVWDDSGSCGGCGGCYGGDPSSGKTDGSSSISAVLSEISLEEDIYRDANTVGTDCVADLAQERLDDCVVEQASMRKLADSAWKVQYQGQRRSIQALTDALTMKRAYANLKDVATSIKDDYSNYSAAVSTVASKRILLDQLLSLKKRVVAARVRTRAQTLEVNSVDLSVVTVSPDLTGTCKQ